MLAYALKHTYTHAHSQHNKKGAAGALSHIKTHVLAQTGEQSDLVLLFPCVK